VQIAIGENSLSYYCLDIHGLWALPTLNFYVINNVNFMSVVIQAIIYPVISGESFDRHGGFFSPISKITNPLNLKLENYQFSNSIGIVIYVSGQDRTFNENLIAVALKMSTETNKTLLVQYDDRLGYRYSCLYTKGVLTKEFTPEDEVWVLVNEEGNPLLDQHFLPAQVDEDEDNEYQTLRNSVELGLDELGTSEKWSEIFESILIIQRKRVES
jgi:hypothetical protein